MPENLLFNFWGHLGTKVKFCAPIISYVSILQLGMSVGKCKFKRWEICLKAIKRHLPHGITQCYPCHPTQVNALRFNPNRTDQFPIYLPQRNERLI